MLVLNPGSEWAAEVSQPWQTVWSPPFISLCPSAPLPSLQLPGGQPGIKGLVRMKGGLADPDWRPVRAPTHLRPQDRAPTLPAHREN